MKTILCALAALLAGTASATNTCRVYFGTLAKGEPAGIYTALLDMQTGQLGEAVHVSPAGGSGFIALHSRGTHLYSASEPEGTLSAFRILEDGTLADINTQSSEGANPCHISIDPTGKNLLVANYSGGSCAVLPIQADGSLGPVSSLQQHSGSSVHPKRQTQPHAHSINCDAAGRFAFVTDLGTDKIMSYRLNAAAGTLTPNDPPFTATEPGGGVRHFTFHPGGRFAYASLELSNQVAAFRYNAENGTLTETQSLSTLPADFTGKNSTSEILTTPDGRFLYVGNRGHNTLAVFAIEAVSGKLTASGHESTRGETPRNFNIDPTGTFLLAANQRSGSVVVFRINQTTGALEFTGSEIAVPAATCIRFLAN